MMNFVIAAVAAIALGAAPASQPAEVPAPAEYISTPAIIQTAEIPAPEEHPAPAVVEVEAPEDYEAAVAIPEDDAPLAAGPVALSTLDAVARAHGFEVRVGESEAVRVYARMRGDDVVRVMIYDTHVFVSHVDLNSPRVLDGGYAFSATLSEGVLSCESDFDVASVLAS